MKMGMDARGDMIAEHILAELFLRRRYWAGSLGLDQLSFLVLLLQFFAR